MKKLLLLSALSLSILFTYAQNYNINTSTVTLNCATGGKLYDTGGPTGAYGQNVQEVMTICTNGDPLGIEVLTATFSSLGDFLCIYDGTSTTAPLLTCYNTSNTPIPGTKLRTTINNASGCLTFQFSSDNASTGGNFELDLACLPACKNVEAVITNTIPAVDPINPVYINNCPNNPIQFFGGANYDANTTGYTQSDATSKFYWDFGDGVMDSTQNPTHTFPLGQIFSINLLVEDAAGCFSRNEIDIRVRQSPEKDIFFSPDPIVVCLGDTIDIRAYLNGSIIGDPLSSDTISAKSEASTVDTVYLPDDSNGISGDGITTPAIIPLQVYGYTPGSTINSIYDIQKICLDIEHSFLGDIDIRLVCPNGQFENLVDFNPPGTPGNDLGVPASGSGPGSTPGTPFEYCWSPTSNAGSIDVGQPSLANSPVLAGTYESVNDWSGFIGCPYNGEWSVQVFDDYGLNDGWAFGASIILNPQNLLDADTFFINYDEPLWEANPKIISPLNDTSIMFYASDTMPEMLYFTVKNNLDCEYIDSVNVQVDYFNIIATPSDTSICGGTDTLQLNASIEGRFTVNCDLATEPCNTTTTVTAGTQTNNAPETPYDGFWEDSRIQLLYTAAELNNLGFIDGNISSLAFNVTSKRSTYPYSNFTIRIQCTSLTDLPSTFINTGFTTVFGPATYSTTAGWNVHNFISPYSWDGTSNLLVEVCFDNNNWSSKDQVASTNTPFVSVTKAETDRSVGCNLSAERNLSQRPNTRFNYCDSQGSFVWTPNAFISDPNIENPRVWPSTSTQYIVSSTSSYNCTYSDTVDIEVGGNFTRDISNDTIICLGESVQLEVTGGAQVFAWTPNDGSISDTTIANPIFTPTVSTTYIVALDSTNTCTAYESVTIEVAVINVDSTHIVNETCFGEANGLIEIFATNSATITNYSIDGGVNFVTSNLFENLAPDVYNIVVRGAANCDSSYQVEILSSTQIIIDSITSFSPTCGNTNDGSINIYAQGGTGALRYSIDSGVNYQTANTFPNLFGGTYNISVQDSLVCSIDSSFTLIQPDPIEIGLIQNDSVSCFGLSDGLIEVQVNIGIAPYEFSIDNGVNYQASGLFNNLSADTYSIILRDSTGCTDTLTQVVNQANEIVLSALVDSVSCFGLSDGEIILNASGGNPSYQFSLTSDLDLQSDNVYSNLASASYNAYVVDSKNCRDSIVIQVDQASPLTITNTIAKGISCFGDTDGSIEVIVNGGSPNYTYSIDSVNFQSSNLIGNLTNGTYTVYVLDANNCSINAVDSIFGPTALNLSVVSSNNITCNTGNDGSIELSSSGGLAPHQYSIDGINFQNNTVFSNLSADNYNITIKDSNNCTEAITQTLSQPNQLNVIIDSVNIDCFGDTDGSITIRSISGETSPYSVVFNGGAPQVYTQGMTFNNLTEGTYSISITDANACPLNGFNQNVKIEVPSLFEIDEVMISNLTCFNTNDGAINITTNGGGIAPYNYYIDNGINVSSNLNGVFNNLAAGVYTIWVVDQNGCTSQVIDSISAPDELVLNIDTVRIPNCFDYDDGYIQSSAYGGSPSAGGNPYIFTLNGENNNTSGLFTNLSDGIYSIKVTDANQCSANQQVLVNDPEPVIAEIYPQDALIEMGDTLSLSVILNNAEGNNYIYIWTPGEGLSCTDCSNPIVNIYNDEEFHLTFYDENGCLATAKTYIKVSDTLRYFIPNAFTPGGFDTTNDLFEVYGQDIKFVDMMIFNRWGEKIYETANALEGWDGTYQNVLQNPGVYTYFIRITFLNDESVDAKGSVTLLR